MQASDIPGKLPIPFASAAGGGYIRSIPEASQIGITDGRASLHDGFVPLNATPIGAGGVPPSIKDMNGILFEISGWTRWVAAGGSVNYDADFATAIGGYPYGAVVQATSSPLVFYVSTADNNTTNPEGGGAANWATLLPVPATIGDLITGTDDVKYATALTLAELRADTATILAGVDPARYMSPLAFFGARAMAADILAGTDDHKYLTPYGLHQAFTGDGQTVPLFGGLFLKFGTNRVFHPGEGAVLVTYANPFPTSTLAALAVGYIETPGDTGNDMWTKTSTRDRNGFYVNYGSGSSGNDGHGFDWIAIGN